MGKKKCGYTQSAILPIPLVVDAMKAGEKYVIVPGTGKTASIASARMQTYTKGTDCVKCGVKGAYFSWEGRPGEHNHLNLYTAEGVMMTSDHIIPKSRGGSKSDLSNRQPMCSPCNEKKGSLLQGETELPFELRNIEGVYTIRDRIKLAFKYMSVNTGTDARSLRRRSVRISLIHRHWDVITSMLSN